MDRMGRAGPGADAPRGPCSQLLGIATGPTLPGTKITRL